MPLIECVPNVSEGRRADVIAALGAAIAVPGVHMLDQSSDPSHNRTVYTFAGEPGAAAGRRASSVRRCRRRRSICVRTTASIRASALSTSCRSSRCTARRWRSACALAKSTAALVAERFDVPVFLYEEAAANDERRSLSEIRRGGVERRRASHEAAGVAPRLRTRSAPSHRRRHRHRRAPDSDRLQREPRVESPWRREAHRVGHPREQRRASPTSRRWACSSTTASSRCR